MSIFLLKRLTALLCTLLLWSCGDDAAAPEMPAPEPPTNLQATAINSNTVVLEWTPSVTSFDNILNYLLLIPALEDTIKVSKQTSSFEVRGLSGGTTYMFFLKAQGTNSKLSIADTVEVLLP
ncbi:MAG: fibronectin type III domain-containing protein [Bacteroidota bacterium]